MNRRDARKLARQQKAQRRAQFYARRSRPAAAASVKPGPKNSAAARGPVRRDEEILSDDECGVPRKATSIGVVKKETRGKDMQTAPSARASDKSHSAPQSKSKAGYAADADSVDDYEDVAVKNKKKRGGKTSSIKDTELMSDGSKKKRRSDKVRKDIPTADVDFDADAVLNDPLLAYAERAIDAGILGSDGEFDEARMDGLFGDSSSNEVASADEESEDGDLYGRDLPTASSSGAQKDAVYVPPRRDAQSDAGAIVERAVRGLLNRLAMSNVEGIVASLANLAEEHPKRVVSDALVSAIMGALSPASRLQDAFVLTQAVLSAASSHAFGAEFAGRLVEEAVSIVDVQRSAVARLSTEDDSIVDDDDGGASPLVLAVRAQRHALVYLSYLYVLRVVACGPLAGLVREAAQLVVATSSSAAVRESETSAVVAVLRICGASLRREDPEALRDLLLDVSAALASVPERTARLSYLRECIDDLRNNRQRGGANEDVETARRTLRGVLHARGGARMDPLAVSLDDVRNVATRGRWWVTGAAWRPTDATRAGDAAVPERKVVHEDSALAALAKQHGFAGGVRRAVFCALMGAEDFVDAHQRISALRLSSRDEREVAHVLLHCVASERKYNAFYALVALRFLALQHNFVVTFRYALWDRLRELEEGAAEADAGVARFYGTLFGHGMLPLSLLVRVSVAQASGALLDFLRTLLAALLAAVAEPLVDAEGLPIEAGAAGDADDRLAAVLRDLFRDRRGAKTSAARRRPAADMEDALAASVMRGVSDSESDAEGDFEARQKLELRRQQLSSLRVGLRLFARMHLADLGGISSRVARPAAPLVSVFVEMLESAE